MTLSEGSQSQDRYRVIPLTLNIQNSPAPRERERLEGRLPGDGGEGEVGAAVQGYRVSGMQEE